MQSLGVTRDKIVTIAILITGAFMVVLNQTLLSPALPAIMADTHVDAVTVQWLTSAYALTEAVVIPMAAWFMGRFSPRSLFVAGMSIFGIGSLIAALAPSFYVILLGRVIQAAATGILMVMFMSLILLMFPRESRGAAMGIVGLVISFAPALGPSVGGLLVDAVGWRVLFAVLMILAFAIAVLAARFLNAEGSFPKAKLDAPSVATSALGLLCLLYGLSTFVSSENVAIPIALIAVGVILMALFARRQFSLKEPLLRIEVLKSRRYRAGCLTIGLLYAVLIGLGVLMPLYIQNTLGLSATESGLVVLPGAVVGAVMGLVSGKVFDRYGVRGISLAGASVTIVGAVGLVFYGASSPIVFVAVAYTVVCTGLQLLIAPVNTWGVNSLGNEFVQHATSVTNTMNQIGGSLGTAFIMSFSALGMGMALNQGADTHMATFSGYHVSFCAVLAIAAIIFVLVLLFVKDKKADTVLCAEGALASGGSQLGSVEEIMDRNPLALLNTCTLSEAAQAMADSGASGAVILDDEGCVSGFLSSGDLLSIFADRTATVVGATGFTAAHELSPADLSRIASIPVSNFATKNVQGIDPSASSEMACEMLASRRIKLLPVIKDSKLVGCVHRSELMLRIAALLGNAERSGESLGREEPR